MNRGSRTVKNNIIIGTLCVVVMIMAVAYAIANTSLGINAKTNISSTWNILITDIRQDNNGQATGTNSIDSALSASFSANLITPKDSVVYHVDVTNNGNLNATLTDIKKKITNKNKYIKINFSGFSKGDALNAGETKTLDITVSFDYDDYGSFTNSIETGIDISLDFAQEGNISAPDRSYGITYDCITNGGNDCSSYNTTLADNEVDLSYEATKEGYTFVGWNTDKDATTGLENIDVENGLVLYAIYKKDIVITYETGEGVSEVGKISETYTLFNNEDPYEVTLPSITAESVSYDGVLAWYEGDTMVGQAGTKYKFTDNTTLTAKTVPKPIMKSSPNLHSYEQTATSIEIVDLATTSVPEGTTNYDISEIGDGSVKLWLVDTNLYIGGFGGVIAPEDCSNLFSGFTSLKTINLKLLNTSSVTNMSGMFSYQYNLTELDVSKFNTSKVTDMSSMFSGCTRLSELDLSNFDTSEVTDMSNMFDMIQGGRLTNLDLSSFNTSKVTDMSNMFYFCDSLTLLDLSNFDTSNVANMSDMFSACYQLKTIYVSDKFVTTNVTNSNYMFSECYSLVGGNGTTYDSSYQDKDYARIDTVETSGYFTNSTKMVIRGISTKSTTKNIDVVVATTENDGEITKYEYSLDGETYIENSTNNTYTFDDLDNGRWYTVYVKVTTKNGNIYSGSSTTTTKVISIPTYSEKETENGKIVTIAYSSLCSKELTCTYTKNDGEEIKVTSDTQVVEFNSGGTIVAKATNGLQEVVSSYTVSMKSMMKSYSNGWSNSGKDFTNSNIREKITSVEIVDLDNTSLTVPTPDNNTSWDVSAEENGTIIAWLEIDSSDNTKYNLYIGGHGGVLANTNSSYLFYYFTNLKTADLTLLDTSSVTDMSYMFYYCRNLTTIYVYDKFNTSNVTKSDSMFDSCYALVGGNGKGYNYSYRDKTYARIDENGTPGYFTKLIINIATTSTTNSISVVAIAKKYIGNVIKYEYSIDGINYYDNNENNTYTFTGLEQSKEYKVYVRTTNEDSEKYIDTKKAKTSTIATPTYAEKVNGENKTLTITYPSGCANGLTCTYSKNEEDDITVTDSSKSIDFEMDEVMVSIVAKVSDGINTVSSSYNVILQSMIDSGNFFEQYSQNITSVDIVDLRTTPVSENAIQTWDVGVYGSKPVTAWLEGTKLYIGGIGQVYANPNSSNLFSGFYSLKKVNLELFNTSQVTEMSSMFKDCNSLTKLDLSNFDTSKVTDTSNMFNNCSNLIKLDLSRFDTSKVTNMNNMFNNCWRLTELDVSNFDTSNVTDMADMFNGCSQLSELDLSNFDTSNVTDMKSMFEGDSNITTIYTSDKFVTSNISNSNSMFTGCGKLVGGNGTTYNESYTDVSYARIDTEENPGYFTGSSLIKNDIKISTTATTNSISAIITTDKEISKYEFSIDGEIYIDSEGENDYTFIGLEKNKEYQIYARVTDNNENVYNLKVKYKTKSMSVATFSEKNLDSGKKITINYPSDCSKGLICTYSKNGEEDIKVTSQKQELEFNTVGTIVAKVSDGTNEVSSSYTVKMKPMMKSYASGNDSSYEDFTNSNYYYNTLTVKVIDLDNTELTVPEIPDTNESWNTVWDASVNHDGSVIAWVESSQTGYWGYDLYIGGHGGVMANPNSSYLFVNFVGLQSADLKLLDTSNVTDMGNMFGNLGGESGCGSLTELDISTWDTSNVTNMSGMFKGCTTLSTLDLSSFDTKNVTNMSSMFSEGWSSLTTIYVSDKFVTNKVTESSGMFSGCTQLVGGNGTTFDSSKIDKEYARIDKDGEPGYFTLKTS